jgi:peptide/nickel transport system permease protein
VEGQMTFTALDLRRVRKQEWDARLDGLRRNWHRFSRNRLSIVGLTLAVTIALLAVFAPWIAPYPAHAGAFTDFNNALQAPSLAHPFGTDNIGRDILSRIIFALRPALIMGGVVLGIVVPVGVVLGLIAGYARGSWLETVIMRITDVFVGVPALVLALAVASVMEPSMMNAMLAVTVMWWPWYVRLLYGISSSLRNEDFVKSAELMGASWPHIIFKEILPNCSGPILTKMSFDMGLVILIGAALSFVGLGEQAPRPGLGTMVSDGARYLPDQWWMAIFPALAIVVVVMSFNLLGDGLQDVLGSEQA